MPDLDCCDFIKDDKYDSSYFSEWFVNDDDDDDNNEKGSQVIMMM